MFPSNTRQTLIEAVLSRVNLPKGITIRPWSLTDCPAIQQLAEAAGWNNLDLPRTVEAWRRSWPALIATNGERVVGILRAISDGTTTTFITDFIVDPAWREKGIGAALLETCHQLFPSAQLEALSARLDDIRTEIKNLHPLDGFRTMLDDSKGS